MIDEIQTPGQCDLLSVEDAKIKARYSNQDYNIDNERVEKNKKSALTKQPNYSPRVIPHKQADYRSPLKKCSSPRKRTNPDKWKRNARKLQRVSGKSYISEGGKKFNQGNAKAKDCSKCRFKCNENVSDESRPSIMPFYYALRSYERQRAFICDMMNIVKHVQSNWKKSVSHQYYLSVENNRMRVCKNFFMKTIDIERKTIDYTVKRKQHGVFRDTDMRGKQPSKNKIEKRTIEVVHRHIRSFTKMESHHSRKNENKNNTLLMI
jgi:hypothetical protein